MLKDMLKPTISPSQGLNALTVEEFTKPETLSADTFASEP